MNSAYDKNFFDGQSGGSLRSAQHVLPYLVKTFSPRSVIDVGCGVGTWLREFDRLGISEYMGIDGDYVDRDQLFISKDKFKAVDLSKPFTTKPFDLACSFEVAEHLPESSADDFIVSLTKAAPIVAFSAAIPHQGGTAHINEQWQSYWAQKFSKQGYLALDFIRPLIKLDEDVEPWYRQNIVVYCRPELRPDGIQPVSDLRELNFVLPEFYINKIEGAQKSIEYALQRVPSGRQSINGLVYAVKRNLGLRGNSV